MSGLTNILSGMYDLISRNDGQTKHDFVRLHEHEMQQAGILYLGDVEIECIIIHKECGPVCKNGVTVELWTIHVEHSTEQCIPSALLNNIIRSHAHFSQLNSWISKDASLLENYNVAFRLTPKSEVALGAGFTHHAFPPTRTEGDVSYKISVDYIKRLTAPLPMQRCEMERKLSIVTDMKELMVITEQETPLMAERRPSFLGNSRLKHKPLPSQLSPSGPAPKIPTLSLEAQEAILPTRRQLKFEENDKSEADQGIASPDEPPSSVAVRGRLRTKSGGATAFFHKVTGLPLSSSPAPFGRQRNSLSTGDIVSSPTDEHKKGISALLGSFEESVLNGRIEPIGQLDGFSLQIAASGSSFCSPHTKLPVCAHYFEQSTEQPLPYYGTCSLSSLGKRGYRIPKQGSFQAVLFNPQDTVVKVFVCVYDVSDMPPSSQSFIRQRYELQSIREKEDKHLQYLIHLRISSDSRGRVYVHKDIRILFTQDRTLDALNLEIQNNIGVSGSRYKLVSDTQQPDRPRYSPKK